MKILYVGLNLCDQTRGGAQKAIQDLAIHLSKEQEVSIHFLTAGLKNNNTELNNSKIFTIGKKPTKWGWNFWRTSKRLEKGIVRLHNKYHYDLIFINTYAGYVPVIRKSNLTTEVKIVYNFHDQPSFIFFDRKGLPRSLIVFIWQLMSYLLKKRAIRSYDDKNTYFIAISNYIKQDLIKCGVKKTNIFLQPNGIEKINTLNRPPNKYKKKCGFYTYGFSYSKGTDKLIYVFDNLPTNNWLLFIAGQLPVTQHPFINRVMKTVKPETRNNIIITGYLDRNNLKKIQEKCHAYISMSLSEACQLSVIEALTRGISVLSTNVGIIPDLLKTKNDRIFILDKDDLEYTKRVIFSFIDNETRGDTQQYENSVIDMFSDWSTVSKNILLFFKQITSKKSSNSN